MITSETMKGLHIRALAPHEKLCELCGRLADQLIIHHMGTSAQPFSCRCEFHRLVVYEDNLSGAKDFVGTPQEWDDLVVLRQVHNS